MAEAAGDDAAPGADATRRDAEPYDDATRDARVALVVPTWNGGALWERALAAWRAQEGVGELEILCPDSGSRDGTPEVVRRAGGRVVDVPPGTFDHGRTRNEAIAQVSAEFVILTVQDALPLSSRTAAALVAPLVADASLCATYGRQVPRPGCHPVLVARIGAWAGGSDPVVQDLAGRDWDALDPWERLGLVRYDHVIACVRRSAVARWPIATRSFGEDVDWAARVIRAGGRIAFVPDAAVEHSHDRGAFDEARRIYCDHRNLSRLLGLVTVPRRGMVKDNVAAARRHYAHLVETAPDTDASNRAARLAWANDLALYENWAQYLGANLSRRWWFRPVDRWLRRGI
ncbi:MAG: glycosyltransferase family 2 protein [Planctomycetes bacterium]|nr:glycosyltransferase family 2 protein [Planctomycetota bacterium]